MDQKKLDWIISIVREEMMTAGAGGFTGAGDPKTKAGFDPVMGKTMRRKYFKGSRKKWLDYLNQK